MTVVQNEADKMFLVPVGSRPAGAGGRVREEVQQGDAREEAEPRELPFLLYLSLPLRDEETETKRG